MASKRRKRMKSCTGKVQHTKDGAFEARRRNKIGGGIGQMNVYKCHFCKAYHIGHSGRGI